MKKALIIILVLLVLAPCFARTFTEEEFYEVYDALLESTEKLKEADLTINSLKTELDNTYSLLDKAEKELLNSAKIIETLNHQKFLIGGGAVLKTDFESLNFGLKINAGYKLWVGYLAASVAYYNDKSMNFGVSYNLVF